MPQLQKRVSAIPEPDQPGHEFVRAGLVQTHDGNFKVESVRRANPAFRNSQDASMLLDAGVPAAGTIDEDIEETGARASSECDSGAPVAAPRRRLAPRSQRSATDPGAAPAALALAGAVGPSLGSQSPPGVAVYRRELPGGIVFSGDRDSVLSTDSEQLPPPPQQQHDAEPKGFRRKQLSVYNGFDDAVSALANTTI